MEYRRQLPRLLVFGVRKRKRLGVAEFIFMVPCTYSLLNVRNDVGQYFQNIAKDIERE